MHALPYAGGLFDQPPGTLFRMEAILAADSQPDTARTNKEEAEQRLEQRLKKGK
jgi:hypothetical protein